MVWRFPIRLQQNYRISATVGYKGSVDGRGSRYPWELAGLG